MLPNIINYQNYYKHNYHFNKNHQLRVLIKKIFQTRDEGNIGYVMSTNDNFSDNRHKYVSSKEISLIDSEDSNTSEILEFDGLKINEQSIFDFNKLGIEERAIISYLKYLEYNHIILTGALGSGKTALLKYLIKYVNEDENKKRCPNLNCCNYHLPIALKIDFNSGYSTKVKSEILRLFQRNLYNKLSREIIKLLKDKRIFEGVIDGIVNYNENDHLDEFALFEDDIIKSKKWYKITQYEKSKLIIKWIENRFGKNDFTGKLEAIYNLLNFIIEILEDRNAECFFIVYDNIDRFDDSIQDDLLELIMSSSNNLRIKHIIAIRLTAFGHISGNGSYSFGVYEHGPCPVEVILTKRIEHYIENKREYYSITKEIPKDLLNSFDNRLKFIKKEFENQNSLITKMIKAFAGLSIRRALFLSERLFLNSSINYEKTNEPYNFLLRALVVGENTNCKIKRDDGLISNIFFLQSDRSNSLVSLKILKLLDIIKINNDYISLRELYKMLSCMMIITQEEFMQSINYLMYVKKRLIYINGVSYFKNKTSVVNCDKTVTITRSGIGYIHNLYETIQYTQDCFCVINWKYNKIHQIQEKIRNDFKKEYLTKRLEEIANRLPNYSIHIEFLLDFITKFDFSETKPYIPKVVDYKSTIDRFQFVRKGLLVFVIQDICEFLYFNIIQVFEGSENCNRFKQLPSAEILTRFSHHAFNTLMSEGYHPELSYWYNLLIICRFWNLLIFEYSSSELNKVIDKFEEHLINVKYLNDDHEIKAANTLYK